MTLFNQGWMTLGGEPVTGRAPTQAVFYAPPGIEPSQQQRGAVAHAYKLFCDAVRNSALPEGFHVQHRTLMDGTRVQMNSNLGRHTVQVWVSGGTKPPEFYCGFAIVPLLAGEATVTWPDKMTLLRYALPTTEWKMWVSPYRPGRATSTPTYFVDSIRSNRMRPVVINADVNYGRDVYCFANGHLFLNAVPHGKVPETGTYFPVVLRQPPDAAPELPKRVYFTIGSTQLQRIASATVIDTLFDWDPTFASGARLFQGGTRYKHVDERAEFLTLGLTTAGALQVRRAELTLARSSPWFTSTGELASQINVPGLLFSSSGYNSTADIVPTDTIYPLQDANAKVCGWIYPGKPLGSPSPDSSFSHNVYGADLSAGSAISHYYYTRSLSAVDSVTLFSGIIAACDRDVTINAEFTTGNVLWENTWSAGRVWTASATPSEGEYSDYSYYQVPAADISSPSINLGTPVNLATQEIGGELTESDTSTSLTTLSTGETLFDTTTTHSVTHKEINAVERYPLAPYSTYAVGSREYYHDAGGGIFEPRWTGWDGFVYPLQGIRPDLIRETRIEQIDVAGTARDYVFFDKENEVYVWFESTMSGHSTQTYTRVGSTISESTSGSLSVSITLKASSPAGEFSGTTRVFSSAVACTANLISPPGISQEGVNRVWKHVSPLMAYPIFVPLWMEQGGCPHIAYSTAEENAAAAAITPTPQLARFLASFRLQISLMSRVGDIVPIEGATTTYAPMMEQLIGHHFAGIYYPSFGSIENEPFTLNASYPGPTVHTDIGITGANPHSELFRT